MPKQGAETGAINRASAPSVKGGSDKAAYKTSGAYRYRPAKEYMEGSADKTADKASKAAKTAPNMLAPEIQAKLNQLVEAHLYAEAHFGTKIAGHADWALIRLLIENDSKGRSTVVKHVIEAAGCSPGTVRAMLGRFQRNGYVKVREKIGRSELYRPTPKLKKFITRWAQANFPDR